MRPAPRHQRGAALLIALLAVALAATLAVALIDEMIKWSSSPAQAGRLKEIRGEVAEGGSDRDA